MTDSRSIFLCSGSASPGRNAANAADTRWYGAYPAIVTDIIDPDGQGRVKVALPWSPDAANVRYEQWARLATLMAG